jgi:hypothetical protein
MLRRISIMYNGLDVCTFREWRAEVEGSTLCLFDIGASWLASEFVIVGL